MKSITRLLYLVLNIVIVVFFSITTSSCGDGDEESKKVDEMVEGMMDSGNVALGFNGKIFLIPSPIQMAMLIQKTGAQYDKKMLNVTDKLSSYNTKFKRCLNLGIYGANLGYCTLYDQTQDALGYFSATNKLAMDLGLISIFDKSLLNRFIKNVGIKDSVLLLVADAYKASNDFLKHNDRNEDAVLVLTGGWIETLHFALTMQEKMPNNDLLHRIAEQKNTLSNIISLLMQYKDNEEYADVLNLLNDLKSKYEEVDFTYQYKEPFTDVAIKTTNINSVSTLSISPAVLKDIANQVLAIRTYITE